MSTADLRDVAKGDGSSVDPVRIARAVGTELAPAARRHVAAVLGDATLAPHLRAVLVEADEALDRLVAEVGQLQTALESRIVIEQAKGLLMSAGVSADDAFDMLRRASQSQNRKLNLVAAELIERRHATLSAVAPPPNGPDR